MHSHMLTLHCIIFSHTAGFSAQPRHAILNVIENRLHTLSHTICLFKGSLFSIYSSVGAFICKSVAMHKQSNFAYKSLHPHR